MLSPDSIGTGRSTSIASGVSAGSTSHWKYTAAAVRDGGSSDARSTIRMPLSASAGSKAVVTSADSRLSCSVTRAVTAASWRSGDIPLGSGRESPSDTAALSAATRTMKNSSRFEATIVANRTRSSSGLDPS